LSGAARCKELARHSRGRFMRQMALCCRLASPPISLSEAR
jgi:hypothetical protein